MDPPADSAEDHSQDAPPPSRLLNAEYAEIIARGDIEWSVRYQLLRRLGSGGQGIVYLAEREGAHDLTTRAALKVFSPERYRDSAHYQSDMRRIARVAMRVAQIQQDHLLDVHNFVQCGGVQVMVMEWIDGYDLHQLLTLNLDRMREYLATERWEYLNDVVVTQGQNRLRLKPGIALAIIRDCLAALSSMHRIQIVHSDIKPSNIMLKSTGHAKLIDLGSAFDLQHVPERATWTPRYASADVLAGKAQSVHSDLASLGYVFLEMISGHSLFAGVRDSETLIQRKHELIQEFPRLLPKDVKRSTAILDLIADLIGRNSEEVPGENAEPTEAIDRTVAEIQRQLVLTNLSSDYENEIRTWVEAVRIAYGTQLQHADSASMSSIQIQTSGIEWLSESRSTREFLDRSGDSLNS